MMNFIIENLGNILIGVVIAGLIALAVLKVVRDKKKGAGCGCGCEGCHSANSCHTTDKL